MERQMINDNPLFYFVLIASVCVVLLVSIVFRWRKNNFARKLSEANPYKIGIMDIDRMEDGSEFEQYLYHLLNELEYEEIYKTTASRDFGADLVFQDTRGLRCVVQAKRYGGSNPVGLSAVQEVYGSMRYYKAQRAIVLTSGKFTEAARILAGVNHVLLLDRDDLMDIIDHFKSKEWVEAKVILEQPPEIREVEWKGVASAHTPHSSGRKLSRKRT